MDLQLPLQAIETVGRGLNRPECVLCTAAGNLYCADWGGGVTRLAGDGRVERILARNADFELKPNGIALCPDGSFLVTELGARGGLYRLQRNGDLTPEILEVEGQRVPPSNFVMLDREERIWITSIVSNRIIYIAPGRRTPEVVLEDTDADHLAWVETAFQNGTMGRAHLDRVRSRKLGSISSLAFGGPDLRTAYLGCLLDDRLYRFRSPVAGHPPVHWLFDDA